MVVLLDFAGEKGHQMFSFMLADNFWIVSHSDSNMERMPRDRQEEAGKLDLVPKLASLWWTSTHESEERCFCLIE